MGIVTDTVVIEHVRSLRSDETFTTNWGVTVRLIVDHDDRDWLVILGGPNGGLVMDFEHIDIDTDGYFEPARRSYEALRDAVPHFDY